MLATALTARRQRHARGDADDSEASAQPCAHPPAPNRPGSGSWRWEGTRKCPLAAAVTTRRNYK